MSAVLRHVAAARPHWGIDYQAEEGKHQVGAGIVRNHFSYGEPYPSEHYDAEVMILLYDTWANWRDRPNTRVSSCLYERFGLSWVEGLGRYQVNVSPRTLLMVKSLLPKCKMAAVHYRGDSSQSKKDLSHAQAEEVCDAVRKLGRTPLLLDWRDQWPLANGCTILSAGRLFPSEHGRLGGSAAVICAIIGQCEAVVGIDSGPSKCASATETPALVVWTGHHPAPFHDPAPNTTHLAPRGYHGLEPVCNDPGVIRWFEAHHNVRQYQDDPVKQIRAWLEETLA